MMETKGRSLSMSGKTVLGIDVGTTAVKVILIAAGEGILAESNQPHDLMSAHPNWAEEDAVRWWENVKAGIRDLNERCPERMREVCCIGCSGMVPAIVLLDEEGNPVRNTIQQNDARATEQIRRLTEEIDAIRVD